MSSRASSRRRMSRSDSGFRWLLHYKHIFKWLRRCRVTRCLFPGKLSQSPCLILFKKKFHCIFHQPDESSSVFHICSALEVAWGQNGAHSAAQFYCWAITEYLIKFSHKAGENCAITFMICETFHCLPSINFLKMGTAAQRRWNPKMEIVTVYSVNRDTQNQRGRGPKALGTWRRSTPHKMTLKSKLAPANWMANYRFHFWICKIVSFSGKKKHLLYWANSVLSKFVFHVAGWAKGDPVLAAEPRIQVSGDPHPELAPPAEFSTSRAAWTQPSKLGC